MGAAEREIEIGGEGKLSKGEDVGDDVEHADVSREESERSSWEYLTRYNCSVLVPVCANRAAGEGGRLFLDCCKVGLGPVKQGRRGRTGGQGGRSNGFMVAEEAG